MRDFEEDSYICIYIRFTDSVWGKLDREAHSLWMKWIESLSSHVEPKTKSGTDIHCTNNSIGSLQGISSTNETNILCLICDNSSIVFS